MIQGLSQFPSPRKLDHLWADHIEILCLCNVDEETSKADISDRMDEANDLGSFDTHEVGSTPAERDDIKSRQIDNWFRHLEYRIGEFGDSYPFQVVNSGSTLKQKGDLSEEKKAYIFMLLSANISHIPKENGNRQALTSRFEILSKKAVQYFLPQRASVHLFESSKGGNHFDGNLWDRIKILAQDINERVVSNERDFTGNNYGDDGLDIVAWIPVGKNPGIPILMGQCACTLEWVDKQRSSSYKRWRERVSMKAPSTNMVFIPHCYRDSSGDWYRDSDIVDSILFDRVRLLNHLDTDETDVGQLLGNAEDIVDAVIEYEEPIF